MTVAPPPTPQDKEPLGPLLARIWRDYLSERKGRLFLSLLCAAVTLEATLPHVTLWTDDAPNGIGVASLADFETKCVRRLTARERQSGIASEKSGTVPDS